MNGNASKFIGIKLANVQKLKKKKSQTKKPMQRTMFSFPIIRVQHKWLIMHAFANESFNNWELKKKKTFWVSLYLYNKMHIHFEKHKSKQLTTLIKLSCHAMSSNKIIGKQTFVSIHSFSVIALSWSGAWWIWSLALEHWAWIIHPEWEDKIQCHEKVFATSLSSSIFVY